LEEDNRETMEVDGEECIGRRERMEEVMMDVIEEAVAESGVRRWR